MRLLRRIELNTWILAYLAVGYLAGLDPKLLGLGGFVMLLAFGVLNVVEDTYDLFNAIRRN